MNLQMLTTLRSTYTNVSPGSICGVILARGENQHCQHVAMPPSHIPSNVTTHMKPRTKRWMCGKSSVLVCRQRFDLHAFWKLISSIFAYTLALVIALQQYSWITTFRDHFYKARHLTCGSILLTVLSANFVKIATLAEHHKCCRPYAWNAMKVKLITWAHNLAWVVVWNGT